MLTYLNGKIIPSAQASVPVSDRGFRFGDGLFESIPVYNGMPYQWAFHMERLVAGLTALRIPYAPAPLQAAVHELIAANGVETGFVRIAISRGSGSSGYLPLAGCIPTVLIETIPRVDAPHQPAKLWESTREKVSPRALPTHCKTAQGLAFTLARMEAADNGCSDALLMNAQGHVAETASANIFWLTGGTLYTPSPATGALSGSTRHAIFRLSPWPVTEVEAPMSALEQAEAVIVSNSSLGVQAVASLAPRGWKWHSEDAARALAKRMADDIAEQTRR